MKYNSIEDLPEVIEPLVLAEFLDISKTAVYKLIKSDAFHVVQIGRIFKIPKRSFCEWFEGSRSVS